MPVTIGGVDGQVTFGQAQAFIGAATYNGLPTDVGSYFTVCFWQKWVVAPTTTNTPGNNNTPFLRITTENGLGTWTSNNLEFDGGSPNAHGSRWKSIGIRSWINGYGPIVNSGTDDWVEGKWYHYTMVGDGANGLKVYQNGVLKASHSTSLIGVGNIQVLRCPENNYHPGTSVQAYAHFKMWSTPLTQTEIVSEMRSGEPFKYEDILCWRSLLGPETTDDLGILGFTGNSSQKLDTSSFGGSVPVAWHRQNALYDLSMGDDTGGDGPTPPAPPSPVTVALVNLPLNLYN